jgi:hypothetical protein
MRIHVRPVQEEWIASTTMQAGMTEFTSWKTFLSVMKTRGFDWALVTGIECFMTPESGLWMINFLNLGPSWYRINRRDLADPYRWDQRDDPEAWVRGITDDLEQQLNYKGEVT